MLNVGDIIKGHFKELLHDEDELSQKRLEICKNCPLLKQTAVGLMCNPDLYMNESGDISEEELAGYRSGCGCRLNAKTRLPHVTCPHGKW